MKVEESSKKTHDRLQFLGLLGPLILLLTLFCTLLKGSSYSWYLFFSTLAGLPLSWKYRQKGLLGSLGLVVLLLATHYAFFPPSLKLWQIGASLSISLGLFTTFLGFEELKGFIEGITVQSQSRLDNLLELDEKFNQAKSAWKYEEAQLQDEFEKKCEALKRSQEESHTLEKMALVLKDELEMIQKDHLKIVSELEEKAQQISSLDQKLLRKNVELNEIQEALNQDRGEREAQLLKQQQKLEDQVQDYRDQLEELQEKLKQKLQTQHALDEEVEQKEIAFKSMQEALRQKVAHIQEYQDKLILKDQDLDRQKVEIDELLKKMNQKEHETLNLKSSLNDRDYQIQKLDQKIRDLQQDLSLTSTSLDEKKGELKSLEQKFKESSSKWENACRTNEIQLAHISRELADVRDEMGRKEAQVETLQQDKTHLKEKLEETRREHQKIVEEEAQMRDKQFRELRKLNDARFALFQAGLDKKRMQKKVHEHAQQAPLKHWLPQIENLLKGDKTQVNYDALPPELSQELLTLKETKALYKQLRSQFDEKNKVLDETRATLYQTETKLEELKKKKEIFHPGAIEIEKGLEQDLNEKCEEIKCMEKEMSILNSLISELLEEKKVG